MPRSGVFLLLLEEGANVCAPHFFFSRERKRNVPRPVQRKRALGAALRAESCSFFFCALRPDSGFPGAMRTGFTFCAADADGCGQASLRAGTNGFRCESRFFFLCVYVLMVGFLMLCGLVFPLAPLPLTGAGGLAFMLKNLAFHWKTAASYGDRDTVWQG